MLSHVSFRLTVQLTKGRSVQRQFLQGYQQILEILVGDLRPTVGSHLLRPVTKRVCHRVDRGERLEDGKK